LTFDDILGWPKAELHCHLDGSVRPQTLLDLAAEQGRHSFLPSDSAEGLEKALLQIDDSTTVEAYLSWFEYTIGVLQSPPALRRAAYELAIDADQENVKYLEIRYSPVLHTADGLTLEQVSDAVLSGLESAERDTGIRTAVIICGLRDRLESTSLRLAELAVDYFGRGVVGFDLAGGEAGNPPKHHLAAFYFAKNHLMNLTVHAGESWGPDSISQALFRCGAHRIGHGTTLSEDPNLMRYFVDHQIPLEICPTSNVQTNVVEGFEQHPLVTYVEAGVPVTISTDNRLFSRTSVTEELWRVHTLCGVGEEDLRQIALNSFVHSFLPWEEKWALVDNFKDELVGPSGGV